MGGGEVRLQSGVKGGEGQGEFSFQKDGAWCRKGGPGGGEIGGAG